MASSPVYMLRMLILACLASIAAAESHHLRQPNNRAQGRSHRAFRQQPAYPSYRYEDAPSAPPAGQPPAERRTFVSVLLAAEIAYLEGVLASSIHSRLKSEREKARRPGRGAGQHPGQHSAPAQHGAPPPRLPYAAREVLPVTEKYVSQLDPFFMLDAPDLSAGGPGQSYERAPGPPAHHPTTGRTSRSNQRIEAAEPVLAILPAPRPTYGAFPLYNRKNRKAPEIVTAAPAARATTRAPESGPAKPTKRLVRGHSKGNWGDFELYHPGGYLPPKKPVAVAKKYKAAKESAPTKASSQLYRATAAPVKAAPAKEYKPVVKEYKPVAVPSKAYKPAPKASPKPAPAPASKPTRKTTPKPAPKPAPSPIYKTSPTIQDVQVLYKTTPTVAYKKPSPGPSPAPAQPHPHTFFHDDQAKQVHKGDWPPIYYNSIHKQQRAALKVARRV